MQALKEAEAWAREHAAVLKVNFAEGVASLQVGDYIAYANGGESLEQALPELVKGIEEQIKRNEPQPLPGHHSE